MAKANKKHPRGPRITSAANRSIAEGDILTMNLVADVPVTWAITGGSDRSLFTLVGSQLSLPAEDYENPQDTGANNTYVAQVTATDANGRTAVQTITCTITPVNELAPVINSNGGAATAAISVAEGATAVTTVSATDADAGGNPISYSITGGADASKFTINGSTGALAFITAPDFEIPTDANADNQYVVVVTASDGTLTDSQALTVTVTDAAEGGGVTLLAIVLSASTFPFGATAGTVVGTISVQASGGSFSGTLGLSGTAAATFDIDGTDLVLAVDPDPGSYAFNIVATQVGATGSPLTSAKTVTGLEDSVGLPAMTVEIAFTGGAPVSGTLVFDIASGVDMGNYVAPTAGFTQRCIRVRHASLPNFFVDFRPDDSGSRKEVVVWNGETAGSVADGYTRELPAYSFVVKDQGATIHSESVPHHYWGSRFRWQSAPRAVIRNASQIFSEGWLPPMSTAAARISGNNVSTGKPWSGRPYTEVPASPGIVIVPPVPAAVGSYSTFMATDDVPGNRKLGLCADVDRGGDRHELGLLTEWQGDWLVRGTASSLAAILTHAEMCSGDWGWFLSDSVTGAPVDFKSDDAHYHMHTYQNGYDTGWYFIKYGNRNGWDIHEGDSHAPNLFYLPYALTEDPYFTEAQQYFVQYGVGLSVYQRDVVWNLLGVVRPVCSYPGEQRTLGNGIRNLAAAYKMTPASVPSWLLPRSYYAAVSADYSMILNHYYNTSTLPRHAIFHTISSDGYFQAFEQAYALLGIGLADLVGMPTGAYPDWSEHLAFYFKQFEDITSGTSGWNRQCPQPHDVLAAELDALSSPTWANAWTMWEPIFHTNASFPSAVSPGNQQGGSMGNCSMILAACAVAKSRGVPGAVAAKAWMDTFIDFNYPNNSDASMGNAFYARCGFDGT